MKALRLQPPAVEWSPELRWVLARAFGPEDRPFDGPVEPAAAFDLADRFDLAARIGVRTPEGLLAAEAAAEAPAYRERSRRTAVRNLLLLSSVDAVAELAGSAGIPFVLLKGLALETQGLVPGGARATGDLDLLVPAERIRDFQSLLLADGWSESRSLELEHQLHPLVHPRHGMVEIHRLVLGVRLPGSRRSADFRALEAAGLLLPAAGRSGGVFTPSVPVLLAHALVHGLVQHGPAPTSYPAFRLLGDVADLGPSRESLAAAGAFLREVNGDDLAAVGSLVRALAEGSDPGSIADPPAAAILLRHLVAGLTRPDYADGLRASERSLVPLSDLPPVLTALRSGWRAAVISREQVDKIYGPPRGSLGYVARQVARPFDLGLRWLRYVAARRRA